jgi:hypothetical protein
VDWKAAPDEPLDILSQWFSGVREHIYVFHAPFSDEKHILFLYCHIRRFEQ